eukprot:CAMPEP_0197863176 /NCGR_PEP_ID=MMETSP1438-20131217/40459_1 /TAXON_ID=1461541 /ORGANISM="Pterosperma sp., Strain CCMP1384" /LENGTH=682 /DNA_ID=CAMNT_0043480985 /DNA_START=313 /DNA_END=2361 /DNA_ORIENTATION=+
MKGSCYALLSFWLVVVIALGGQITSEAEILEEQYLQGDHTQTHRPHHDNFKDTPSNRAGTRSSTNTKPTPGGSEDEGTAQQVHKIRDFISAWEVSDVVVYRDSAEVSRYADVALEAGTSEVTVWGITASMMANTVRVSGTGAATILEVREARTAMDVDEVANRTAEAEGCEHLMKQEQIKHDALIKKNNAKASQINEERNLIFAFVKRALMSEVEGLSESMKAIKSAGWESLDDILSYRRQKIESLDTQLADLEVSSEESKDRLVKMKTECKTKRSQINVDPKHRNTFQVTVLLEAAESTTAQMQLSYATYGASWNAIYECRATTHDSNTDGEPADVALTYQAEVSQSTGEDWLSANIKLSTMQPTVGGEIPSLPRQVISLDSPYGVASVTSSRSRKVKRREPETRMKKRSMGMPMAERSADVMMMAAMMEEDEDEESADDAGVEAEVASMKIEPRMEASSTTITEGAMGVVYVITRPANIPSDGRPHKVVIGVVDLEPVFEYVAVPRVSMLAYLTMRGINKSPYILLPGPLATFLDGTATSTTKLPRVSPQENFTLSFGVDEGVKVKEVPVPKRDESGGVMFISETRKRTITHLFAVTNLKPQPVKVIVRDSIPESSNKDLKVTLEEHTSKAVQVEGAKLVFNKVSSEKIEWELKLPPGVEQNLQVKVSVQWPTGRDVYGL